MNIKRTPLLTLSLIALSALTLSACSSDGEGGGIKTEAKYPQGHDRNLGEDIYAKPGSVFGPDGLSFGGKKDKSDNSGAGIGVNSFLWRASLDTVSFMPVSSADPFGGTIITDWYTPDESKGERYKINVFIMGRQLRSDGVRVRVFQQNLRSGTWFDIQPPADMATKLEDAILTRARQMRVSQID
ncbi:MAG: DUF3576 domain-containing protein [Micavibrio sp.]|nr:DUF3576 domain-containing protein [Micavibrio sp.]